MTMRLTQVVALIFLSVFPMVGCQHEPRTGDEAYDDFCFYANVGNFDGMREVLEHFPDVIAQRNKNTDETALHYAAITATPDVIAFLAEAGANINARNKYGETPLWLAVLHGKTDNVQELLKRSANVHIPSAENALHDGVMPLEYAAGRNCPDIIRLLAKHGADVNRLRPDQTMWASALHWAACSSHADAVDALLECGADPNLTTEAGLTPLMMVVYRRFSGKDVLETESDIRIVKTLLAAGATCDAEFVNGETPASHSQKYKSLLPQISKLLAAAAESKEDSAQSSETESQPGVD